MFPSERIGKFLEDLKAALYPLEEPVAVYQFQYGGKRFSDVPELDPADWTPVPDGQLPSGGQGCCWLETLIRIPDSFDGRCVTYRLTTGTTGDWDASNPQFQLYVNNCMVQGLDARHPEAMLTERARSGEQYRVALACGEQSGGLRFSSRIRVLDRLTERYYYDVKTPYDAAMALEKDHPDRHLILEILARSENLLDLRRLHSKEYYESLEKARNFLSRELYDFHCGQSERTVHAVARTRIDPAWLWTLDAAEDKIVRSFSTVLELMREYPEYVFFSGQPQLYKMLSRAAPDLYKKVKRRIWEKRWEPDGGMWVEAECSLISGESLVRQILHGKRFFRQEFQRDSVVLWLTGNTGFSPALPQIMEQCGIRYLLTGRESGSSAFPYDTFVWEGLDGARVLTHRAPDDSREQEDGGMSAGRVQECWLGHRQKYQAGAALLPFGYENGGGGPSREHLEYQRRLSKGLPGLPKTSLGAPVEFFDALEVQEATESLPVWVGEIESGHKGAYTTLARNKKLNRQSENTYLNAEFYSVMGGLLAGTRYRFRELHDGWEVLLLNQAWPILAGAAIKEVYDESRIQYEAVLRNGERMIQENQRAITAGVNAPQGAVVVFNHNSACAPHPVAVENPPSLRNPVVYDGPRPLPTQVDRDGALIFVPKSMPQRGYKTFFLRDCETLSTSHLTVTPTLMENDFFRLHLDEKGRFESIYDKRRNRELLKPGSLGNRIASFQDRPYGSDTLDLDPGYEAKSWELDRITGIRVEETGPVRGTLRVDGAALSSSVSWCISIYKDVPRIDIRYDINWNEQEIMLKTFFPLDLHTHEVVCGTQYGNIRRATHANTPEDQARFESSYHQWLDLSEDDYGVSLLSDVKYGYSARDGVVGLTMLRSPVAPNAFADKERHSFTFSLYPHSGGWREASTAAHAYALGNPYSATVKEGEAGTLPTRYSLVEIDCDGVLAEVVKRSEDGEWIILRVYECYNRRSRVSLTLPFRVESAGECNMLEEHQRSLGDGGKTLSFTMRPYEIKTIRIRPEQAEEPSAEN